ncbi:unnamed protein product [Phytophthora fragariaefolia]|uniref:Unnamed protein product n=1 Tax=Phytophthora fragariaefolia TaxID=1490495 RepID=A0A9W7CVG1_9STRA|nr:unnamed protein product [Phytophthora fragariaefolia]
MPEREDREAKKRQADEEAAKIYATFVASFDDEDETRGKAFVRGGTQDGARQSAGDVYRLRAKEPAAETGRKVSEMDKMLQEIKHKDADRTKQIQSGQKPKKRRAIDEFLEEMKERGPAPVSTEGASVAKGSFDTGDPETTNLYVGNLAPTVTEELEGQPIIVGWGKAVKIQPRARAPGLLLPSAITPPSVTPAISSIDASTVGTQTITIEMPTDESVKQRVDHLARYVAADGQQFENAVRMREANNKTDYGFLFEPQSPLALYYRWRVYSFAMGDNEQLWREDPFQMTVDGPVWVPPKAFPWVKVEALVAVGHEVLVRVQEDIVDDMVEVVIAPEVVQKALPIA